jgi:hypothetical protein
VRDNNFTSGGRGSLHGRHSRGEGMMMHSTAAQPPSRQRVCPSQPSCCPVHRRSYFRMVDTEFDAVPELEPNWNRHPRLASEMHCTIAHRLTSHTHPTRSPAKPADSWIPPRDSPLLSRLQGELWRSRPGSMSLFGGQASTSCSAADSSGVQQNLTRPPRPPRVASELLLISTTDLRPEPTAASS